MSPDPTATAARRVPPDPGRWACCGGTRQHGHDADCITVVGYWRLAAVRMEAEAVTDSTPTTAGPMREPFVNVRKVSHTVQVSAGLLMDAGLIADDRPAYVPTRRQRFRWWRQERLRRARMRLASWVAGFDVEEQW